MNFSQRVEIERAQRTHPDCAVAVVDQVVVADRVDEDHQTGAAHRQPRNQLAEQFGLERQLATPVRMRADRTFVHAPELERKLLGGGLAQGPRLVASVLNEAGLDPTFVIGGRLNSAGSNAKLGSGDYIVVEADESDASFLNLLPVMAVVTNIDADHMETYGHDFNRLKGAFVDFLHRMPFYGTAILCTDDPAVKEIVPQVTCPITSYGFNDDAQVRAVDVRAVDGTMQFTVQRRNGVVLPDLAVTLNLPGRHNVLNALSAIAVAVELNVPDAAVQKALSEFKGVGRRFQRYGDVQARDGGVFTVIDDYGHHPVEMAATLAAARGAFPGRRLVLAFQPHRFTRTRDCFEDFVKVIGQADVVLLAEVYAAGEVPIVAADGRSLARALRVAGKVEPVFVDDITQMPQVIADNARGGDVVVCMGAGSIGAVPGKVVEMLQKSELMMQKGRGL